MKEKGIFEIVERLHRKFLHIPPHFSGWIKKINLVELLKPNSYWRKKYLLGVGAILVGWGAENKINERSLESVSALKNFYSISQNYITFLMASLCQPKRIETVYIRLVNHKHLMYFTFALRLKQFSRFLDWSKVIPQKKKVIEQVYKLSLNVPWQRLFRKMQWKDRLSCLIKWYDGPSLPIFACTNTRSISSVRGTFCGSWKQGFLR